MLHCCCYFFCCIHITHLCSGQSSTVSFHNRSPLSQLIRIAVVGEDIPIYSFSLVWSLVWSQIILISRYYQYMDRSPFLAYTKIDWSSCFVRHFNHIILMKFYFFAIDYIVSTSSLEPKEKYASISNTSITICLSAKVLIKVCQNCKHQSTNSTCSYSQ